MKNACILLFGFLLLTGSLSAQHNAGKPYFPGPGETWERRAPAGVGMDAQRLEEAIRFAIDNESKTPRNLEEAHYQSFGREPFGDGVGPFRERGAAAGIIIRHGYIVAEWGDVHRVDMTFSVSKSFLSSTVGLAYDRGLIRDIHDLVYPYMAPVLPFAPQAARDKPARLGEPYVLPLFESEHNRRITWDHLLRQTSAWQGALWGKPDWADRPSGEPATWMSAEPPAPGTVYEYNDTRVNLLALAALNVWRRPLPEVLREYIMDPIGASPTWRWYGYENSWIELDGRPVQSVSGGGHWGGGMFISARDQARFGLLTLHRGKWNERQLLSEKWVQMALTPTEVQPTYGFMNWFLNTDRKLYPSAPATAFAHLGNGTNMVYVDPGHDLVVVARWISNGSIDGFLQRVLAAVK